MYAQWNIIHEYLLSSQNCRETIENFGAYQTEFNFYFEPGAIRTKRPQSLQLLDNVNFLVQHFNISN